MMTLGMPSIVPLMPQSFGISYSLRRRKRSSSLTDLWNRGCLFREFSFAGEGISHTTPERDLRPRLHDQDVSYTYKLKKERKLRNGTSGLKHCSQLSTLFQGHCFISSPDSFTTDEYVWHRTASRHLLKC